MATREDRAAAVEQMNANLALEGFAPDIHDEAMQKEYIEGEASIEDLLRDARRFAEGAGEK